MRFVLIVLVAAMATIAPWLLTEQLAARQARLEARMNALEEALCNLPIIADPLRPTPEPFPLPPAPPDWVPGPILPRDRSQKFVPPPKKPPRFLEAANERE